MKSTKEKKTMTSKWIWNDLAISKDDYAYFKSSFKSETGKIKLKISVDTDYMVFFNKKVVAFGQYPCFPYAPVYDEIDLKCRKGDNDIVILVYYSGSDSHSTYYYSPIPGLYFSIKEGDKTLLVSDENILSGRYLAFEHGHADNITPQLGYRTFYDSEYEGKHTELRPSVIVDKSYNLEKRGNLKTKLFSHIEGKYLKNEPGHLLIDFEKERTAYLDLDFYSSKRQEILICWGEHINDGGVRYLIENRNFSTVFKAKKGRNKHFYTFRRYGLRYLEVFYKDEIKINKFGLREVYYPFKEKKIILDTPLHQKIFDVAKYTLKCCYHEHFEDCPWREQSFYAMDSRNQMLFHSVVFKNSETIKSALKLLSQDRTPDNILCITSPANHPLKIPSYSLYLVEEVYLYAKLYKDPSIFDIMYDKLVSLMDAFIKRIDKGILQNFIGKNYWNFYEWVPGLDYPKDEVTSDIILNSLLIISLKNMDKINKAMNKPLRYQELIKKMIKACRKYFYNQDDGLCIFAKADPQYYCLANSFACLSGIASKKQIPYIAEQLINNKSIIPSSSALRVFMYDVLISVDKAKYKDYIIGDIDRVCEYQLNHGATTFWETELGEADFNNAGSLCHAWCAYAVYYYKKLLK